MEGADDVGVDGKLKDFRVERSTDIRRVKAFIGRVGVKSGRGTERFVKGTVARRGRKGSSNVHESVG